MKTGYAQRIAGHLVALLIMAHLGRASHIVGGEITMKRTNATPGLFAVQLNQYWDQPNVTGGNTDPEVWIGVFRKRDNALIDSLRLPLQKTESIAYKNTVCAKQQNLSTLRAVYLITKQFDVTRYVDPDGYYITWDRCCRNRNISSFNGTNLLVGMMFYMAFPPMLRNGVNFTNSSPEFGLPNGEYICLNKLFTTDFSATDADSDELRYSLVTPYRGFSTQLVATQPVVSRSTFPLIPWAAGLSAQNAIPGNPTLTISPAGKLTVKASLQGLFLFTVQVEEWRSGVRIGLVRRDFQLPVVECRSTPPPPAAILSKGQTVSAVTVCPPAALTLTTENDPKWSYQWQRDSKNLVGEKGPKLLVTQSGVYAVVKSAAATCATDTLSEVVTVTVAPSITLTGQPLYRVSPGASTSLTVQVRPATTPLTWTPPLYLSDVANTSPTCTPLDSVTYRVLGRSPEGCEATLTVRVELIGAALYIPSAFTPNGDASNDVWKLTNASAHPDMEVFVYSRWGDVIFYSKGYAIPWTGQIGDVPAPPGTYTYLIRDGADTYRGAVMVLQ